MSTPRLALVLAGALALGALTGLAPPSAGADPPEGGIGKDSPLSTRLQEINAEPGVAFTAATEEPSTPPNGPGSLLKYDAKRYLVEIRVDDLTQDVVDDLTQAGATVTHEDEELRLVTAAVEPSRLDEVAEVEGVEYVADVLTPITHCGSVESDGDAILGAAVLRGGVGGPTGSGVTVGILSDSFAKRTSGPTTAAQDVTSKDLPGAMSTPPCNTTSTRVLEDYNGGRDEARAMAQIVHDVAPASTLAFGTAFTSISGFADNLRQLAADLPGGAAADVIVDDVSYFEEPFYQPGPIDDAIKDVTAAGVQYFSSAGNSNVVVDGKSVGSYETMAYRPTTCPTLVALPAPDLINCHDFSAGPETDNTFGFRLKAGERFVLDLQWAEAQRNVTRDMDVYLLDGAGNVLNSSIYANPDRPGSPGSQTPFEALSYTNSGSAKDLQIVIGHYVDSDPGGPYPRMKFIFVGGPEFDTIEYATGAGGDVMGPTIFGHNGGPNTISVAASSAPDCGGTRGGCSVNEFSSRGPVTHLFGPVGAVPAPRLAQAQVLSKPDLAASDCTLNTFFGSAAAAPNAGKYRFCGTSAAAPHAAGVAALLADQLSPPALGSPTWLRVLAALRGGATDIVPPTVPAADELLIQGSGLLDAGAAAVLLGQATPPISLLAPATALVDTSAPISAISPSGAVVSLGTSGPCSAVGFLVTFSGEGTCTVQAATTDGAPMVSKNIQVSKRTQSIHLLAPGSALVGIGAPINAAASSELGVVLSVGPVGVCSLNGGTLSFPGEGTCNVTATQAGNLVFAPATLALAIPVSRRAQAISFNAPGNGTVGGNATLVATATSNLPVTLTIASAGICSLSGAPGNYTVNYVGAGTCTINADQAGNDTFSAAPQVQRSIFVPAPFVPPPPPPPPSSGGGSGGGGGSTSGSCAGKRATITGTMGRDTIRGTNGRDVIDARGGNDKIDGRGGNDLICGGNGDDRISGGDGSDNLRGGAGRDVINGGSGRDSCTGGAGRDSISSC